MRVAIVGGGGVGLATALHLAPLVKAGLIAGPVDVYDAAGHDPSPIGVGIWSTALYGFRDSTDVESHQIAYKTMVDKGSFSEKVGFRSPRGDWLAESNLAGEQTPDFLFLRESDMLGALQKAVEHEIKQGNVVVHSGFSSKIHSVAEDSPNPWSAPLMIEKNGPKKPSEPSERDYHLIVAADGMNSNLRKTYGGHKADRKRFLGTNAMENISDGPLDIPNANEHWALSTQSEATGTVDRNYHVFRGNSPVTQDEVKGLEKAFQTWGESGNMRFATVPMKFSLSDGKTEERHTWFITIDDEKLSSEKDPKKRKAMLLEAFRHWHDPIQQLVEATPADEILMDRAVAHKHSCEPIVNFNDVVSSIRKTPVLTSGNGPAIQFVGDAFMTVDPILAQGFTIGVEGAATLAKSLSTCLDASNNDGASSPHHGKLAFDPYLLRKELLNRHDSRLNRLICLLRSSEIVQALGQPVKGSLPGLISRDVIRPLMRLTPDFIKTPIFNRVMEYSLGLHSMQK